MCDNALIYCQHRRLSDGRRRRKTTHLFSAHPTANAQRHRGVGGALENSIDSLLPLGSPRRPRAGELRGGTGCNRMDRCIIDCNLESAACCFLLNRSPPPIPRPGPWPRLRGDFPWLENTFREGCWVWTGDQPQALISHITSLRLRVHEWASHADLSGNLCPFCFFLHDWTAA